MAPRSGEDHPGPPGSGVVDIWRIPIPERAAPEMVEGLSRAERVRMARFRADADQVRFAVTRDALRHILAGYLEVPPGTLRFSTRGGGKPCLVDGGGVEFNVAHAGRLALCAMTRLRAVGVDLEPLASAGIDWPVVARFYSRVERERLEGLHEADAGVLFTRIWTRKEALVKADGGGLGVPLTELTVVAPGPLRLRGRTYHVGDLDVGEGYVAALAVEGGPARVRFHHWGN